MSSVIDEVLVDHLRGILVARLITDCVWI